MRNRRYWPRSRGPSASARGVARLPRTHNLNNPPIRSELTRALRAYSEAIRAERDAGVTWHFIEGGLPSAESLRPAAAAPKAVRSRNAAMDATERPTVPTPATVAPPPAIPVEAARPRPASPLTREAREAALASVASEVSGCTACSLCAGRTLTVPGEGSSTAAVMFVGEGPGEQEDLSGRPFVGRAGQLLRRLIIEELGLDPADVFIANVVKCRPPGNRAPAPDEVAACLPFLRRQVAAVRPRFLVTLGNPATQSLLQTKEGITKLRGRPVQRGEFTFFPTFHPSYLLRNVAAEPQGREDFRTLRALLDAPRPSGSSSEKSRGAP